MCATPRAENPPETRIKGAGEASVLRGEVEYRLTTYVIKLGGSCLASRSFRLGNIRPGPRVSECHDCGAAVIALVGNHLFHAVDIHLRLLVGGLFSFPLDQLFQIAA